MARGEAENRSGRGFAARLAIYALVAVVLSLAPVVVWRDPAPSLAALLGLISGFWSVQTARAIAARDGVLMLQGAIELLALGPLLYFGGTLGAPESWPRVGILGGAGFALTVGVMWDALRGGVFAPISRERAR